MDPPTVDLLVQRLRSAARAYYETDTPLLTDAQYDDLVEDLRRLAPNHPFFQEVGALPTVGVVTLPVPMPSLDKRKPDGFKPLKPGVQYCVSDKLDGISALWVTGYSVTPQLVLRGNGLQGQDVTPCAKAIQGLCKLAIPKAYVRGELIVPKGVLAEGILARNWVNGQLHQKTPMLEDLQKIHFVAYQVCGTTTLSRSQQLTWLSNQGFETCWSIVEPSPSLQRLQDLFKSRRAESKYECDGIVVGEDQVPALVKGASNPSDAFAFKMAVDDQRAMTIVREVEWASSRTGNWVPRLRFDPVKIGTATIEYCTGIHAKFIKENRLGPGARIMIRRSGDVIPCLDQVLEPATTWSEPPTGRWSWDESGTHAVDTTQEATPEKLALELAHQLESLGIEGISKVTCKKLVDKHCKTLKQVWDARLEDLQAAIGPGNGQKLFTALRTLAVPELKWIRAYCGWPKGFGETRATALLALESNPSHWSRLTAPPKGQSAESFAEVLKAVPGFVAWRSQFPSGAVPVPSAPPQPVASKGVYCMTGFRDTGLQATLAAAGYTFKDTVSASTAFLLIADGAKETTKIAAARKAGIRIVPRSEAATLFEGTL